LSSHVEKTLRLQKWEVKGDRQKSSAEGPRSPNNARKLPIATGGGGWGDARKKKKRVVSKTIYWSANKKSTKLSQRCKNNLGGKENKKNEGLRSEDAPHTKKQKKKKKPVSSERQPVGRGKVSGKVKVARRGVTSKNRGGPLTKAKRVRWGGNGAGRRKVGMVNRFGRSDLHSPKLAFKKDGELFHGEPGITNLMKGTQTRALGPKTGCETERLPGEKKREQ